MNERSVKKRKNIGENEKNVLIVSFLSELFSCDFFKNQDFVFAWSNRILKACCAQGLQRSFEVDLCTSLCFVMFSPFCVTANTSCIYIFSKMNLGMYSKPISIRSDKSARSFNSLYDNNTTIWHENCNEKNQSQIYEEALKDVYKEIYVTKETMSAESLLMLEVLVKKTGKKNKLNLSNDLDCLRKFMVFAVLREMVELLIGNVRKSYMESHREDVFTETVQKYIDRKICQTVEVALIHFRFYFKYYFNDKQERFFKKLSTFEYTNGLQMIRYFEEVFHKHWGEDETQ